jgi:membrane protein implicated in regulation of membrane protease activity
MTTPLEFLQSGHYVQAVINTFTDILGSWFWVIILFVLVVVSYMKSGNVVYPAVMAIIGTAMFAVYGYIPTQYQGIFYTIAALAIATMIYAAFGKRSN